MTRLDDEAANELSALAAAHRLRGEYVVDGRQGAEIVLDGRRVVSFASNDYLGLAGDERIVEAMRGAVGDLGVGAGASRLIVGNHRAHVGLEAELAAWLEVGAVRTFSSGYAANVGVIGTLARAGDVVFSDALNHASIIDGCRLARAEVAVFAHRDLAALEALLRGTSGRRKLVITESLFSMDGDVADVREIAGLCERYDASWIVDEAHAVGVYGPAGRGVCAEHGVRPDVLIGTFGKAFGTAGAFVASSHAVAELVWNRARSFVFSTGTPPALARATAAALAIVRGTDGAARRARVRALAAAMRAGIPKLGGDVRSPIAPLVVGDDQRAMELSAALLAGGVFAQGIRPPTVPERTARIRFGITAAHTAAHVDQVVSIVRGWS